MIAVVGSGFLEMKSLLNNVEILQKESMGCTNIYTVKIVPYEDPFLIVDTGYGKVNIGISLGIALQKYPIDMLLLLGDCGYITTRRDALEDIAISSDAVQYDVDFCPIGHPLGQIPGVNQKNYEANEYLIELAISKCKEHARNFQVGRYATADRFVANTVFSEELKHKFECCFVDSECGNLGEFAVLYDIPYVCVKGISNYANCYGATLYYEYREEAYEHVNAIIYSMLLELLSGDVLTKMDCGCEKKKMSGRFDIENFRVLSNKEIKCVLDKSKIASFCVSEDNVPYVVPMCFAYEEAKGQLIFRMFSLDYGRKMRCIEHNKTVALQFEWTTIDGVMSVVVCGTAKILTGDYRYACNDDVVLIEVTTTKVAGRCYYFC